MSIRRVRACAKAEARRRLAEARRRALNLACRNKGANADPWDGSCLRCGAYMGETCRPLIMGIIVNDLAHPAPGATEGGGGG
jgi:hypothetical protein